MGFRWRWVHTNCEDIDCKHVSSIRKNQHKIPNVRLYCLIHVAVVTRSWERACPSTPKCGEDAFPLRRCPDGLVGLLEHQIHNKRIPRSA